MSELTPNNPHRQRVTPGGWAGVVNYRDAADPRHECLYLAQASILPAREVASYLRWVHDRAAAVNAVWDRTDAADYPQSLTYPNLCPGILPDRLRDRAAAPADPEARVAWLYLYDLKTRADLGRLTPQLARQTYKKIGYEFWVWPDEAELELSFKLYDPGGKVMPNFDLGRRPAADIEAIIRGPEILDFLASL